MKTHQWFIFAALCFLALIAHSRTDYAIFMTGAMLLWALTEAPKKEKPDAKH